MKFEPYESDDDDEPTEWERWQDFFRKSTREAKEYLSTVRTCRCHNHQNRLLSPGLSDEDATDGNVTDEGATDGNVTDEGATESVKLGFPTIHPSAPNYIEELRRVSQKQPHASRTLRNRDTTDGDVADEDTADEGATGSNELGSPTIHPRGLTYTQWLRRVSQEMFHAPRTPRKRDTTPPQRKRRQPPKKDKEEDKQNKSREKAIEAFLSSKRSSRRNRDCTLWQLGDDGMARTASMAR